MKALKFKWMLLALFWVANLHGQSAPTTLAVRLPTVFEEPLAPVGGEGSPQEREDLAAALRAYERSGLSDLVEPLEKFLSTHPRNAWEASLRMNMGLAFQRTGWPSTAMHQFEAAWRQTRTDRSGQAVWIADRAVTEWMWLCVKAGNEKVLERLLRETEGRPMRGGSAQRRLDAARALFAMQKEAKFYLCGPTALAAVKSVMKPGHLVDPRDVKDTIPGPEGTSLFQLAMMALNWDIPLQMLKRTPGSSVLIPAVMHWKTGHWAAVIREAGGRYLVQEDVLEEAVWVRREALDSETTGYCLAPHVPLPQGWTRISAEEGRAVWGRGRVGLGPWYGPYDDSAIRPRMVPGPGITQAGVRMGNLSLEIWSTPLSIPSHNGPAWPFELRYQQRVGWQPDQPSFSHLGPHWMFTGLSYLLEDPSSERQDVHLFTETGTWLRFTGFDPATGRYERNRHTRDLLVRDGHGNYEFCRGDGTIEYFSKRLSAGPSLNRVFRVKQAAPSGSILEYEYDADARLSRVRDEGGRGFTYVYGDMEQASRLTRVVDSHGREVRFGFDPSGRMSEITDAAGQSIRLSYDDRSLEPDVPTSLVTPQGRWAFRFGQQDLSRWIEWVDPGGKSHRAEFLHDAPGLPVTDPVAPQGPLNQYMHDRSTYYWAPEILERHQRNYQRAEAIRYLFNPTQLALCWSLEAVKQGDDPRIWFLYPGQVNTQVEGTRAQPAWIAQKIGLQEHRWDLTWNDQGNLMNLQSQDGSGASWVSHTRPGAPLLASTRGPAFKTRVDWDASGHPVRTWSGDQLVWEAKRDGQGKIYQVRDAKGRIWNLGYEQDGRWTSLKGPSVFRWTFDALGRVVTLQEGSGKAVMVAYDALDRALGIAAVGPNGSSGAGFRRPRRKPFGSDSFIEWAGLPKCPPVLPLPSVVRSWTAGADTGLVGSPKKQRPAVSGIQAIRIVRWITLLRDLEPPSVAY